MPYENEQLTIDHESIPPQGVYPLLRSLDSSVREVRDSLYDHERESGMRQRKLEEETSSLRKEMTDMKITLGVMDHRQADTSNALNGLIETVRELKADVKAVNAKVDTLQTKLGMYISILGIGISIVLVIFQLIMR